MGSTDKDTSEKKTWFWNRNINELESDLEWDKYFNEKEDLGLERSRTEKITLLQNNQRK